MPSFIISLALTPLIAAVPIGDAEFEAPLEIKAGGKDYSHVLYPSPVFHDLDGDGRPELVIGDLMGRLQSASRVSAGEPFGWAPSTMMKATDGKDLKFSNW